MKILVPADAILIPDNAKRVFEGVIFDVYQWPQKLFDGSSETYEMIRRPDTVVIIGVVDEKLLLIDEHQPTFHRSLTFPLGKVDQSDESVLAAARREMREETGYEFGNWRLIDIIQPHVKLEWFIHIFLAVDGRQTNAPKLEAGENIKVELKTFEEIKKLSFAGEGYLRLSQNLFFKLGSLEDLLKLPEFKGKEVDR